MAGPKPKRRGPKRGERVGGVWPEEVLLAVRRVRRKRSRMMMDWRVGSRSCRMDSKWFGGYPRARN